MKIGIDISPTNKELAGIGQYTRSLTRELLQITENKDLEYYLYNSVNNQEWTRAVKPFPNVHLVIIPTAKYLPFKGIRWINKVSRDAREKNLDLFLSFSNILFSLIFPKTIQFIYDLSPVKFPQFYSSKTVSVYNFTTKIAAMKALKLITISRTMQEEIMTYSNLPASRIAYIYPGLSTFLMKQQENKIAPERKKINLPEHYLLNVSTLEPKKNMLKMIESYSFFKKHNLSDYKLVIAGKKGWQYQRIFKLVEKLNLQKEIIFLDYIPDDYLAEVYRNAKLYINLSMYEGFGMTPMEALYFNIPTILSDIPVFRECYEGLAKFVQPDNIKQVADAIKLNCEHHKAKNTSNMIKDRYSWNKSAKKLLNIIGNYEK